MRDVIEGAGNVSFFVPETAQPPGRRRAWPRARPRVLRLRRLIGCEVYGQFEMEARERLNRRDPDDWPILASALALGCPIWTEDTDFFGCGAATWTSDRVQGFLRA